MKLKWVKKILTLTLAFSVFMGEAAVGPMQVYAAASEISTLEESEEATSQQPEEKAEDGEEIHRQEADAELYAKNINEGDKVIFIEGRIEKQC